MLGRGLRDVNCCFAHRLVHRYRSEFLLRRKMPGCRERRGPSRRLVTRKSRSSSECQRAN